MIIDPVTVWKMAPIIMDLVGKYTGKEKAASIFNNILSLSTLGDVFKDPKIDETPETPETPKVPDKDTGLSIGGGLLGKYASKLPGVQGLGKKSLFDPNYNVGQLGIHPYNDTPATLTNWLE